MKMKYYFNGVYLPEEETKIALDPNADCFHAIQIRFKAPPKKNHFRRVLLDAPRNCPIFYDIPLEYIEKN